MERKIYYITYYGLPLSGGRGKPYHAEQKENLISMKDLANRITNFRRDKIRIKSMSRKNFCAKEWPQ